MKKDIAKFVSKCLTCHKVKFEYQRHSGKFQEIPIPEWKWKMLTIDFVSGLPHTTREYDSICVIVDRLIKSVHTYSAAHYAKFYVQKIVRLHRIPTSIISDRGP